MRGWLGANAFLLAIIVAGASLFLAIAAGLRLALHALGVPPDLERAAFAIALLLAIVGAGVWGAIAHEKLSRWI